MFRPTTCLKCIPELSRSTVRFEKPEVFVHGALCVAYSGQCLTSEALGKRSANRGECAQACRMPYDLVVDGEMRDLGDRRYLLSPQDLAAVEEIPRLLERGVVSFKIEGRLKSPEYVAAVCQVYRRALDAAMARQPFHPEAEDWRQMEMSFSRGFFTGWLHGVDHQHLVSARFGKKRGSLVGAIEEVGPDWVRFQPTGPLTLGDGVVFDLGEDTNAEQGGRIFERRGDRWFFQHGRIDFKSLRPGARVWKTDDPALNRRLRQSFARPPAARRRAPIDLRISGHAGAPLMVACGGVQVSSRVPLEAARTAPLTAERLREQFGKLTGSPFQLGEFIVELEGAVILPLGEINRLRRELVYQLLERRQSPRPELPDPAVSWRALFHKSDPTPPVPAASHPQPPAPAALAVLCRTPEQITGALAAGADTLFLDFEDLRRYREGVAQARREGAAALFLATPRIQKAGEQGFFRLIEQCAADGVLVRNLGALEFFRGRSLRLLGDFSLNVANPLTAQYFLGQGLERLTISYDLDSSQVLDLLSSAPPEWFELTLHQHLPMFHMEHCVFAAFLSSGASHLDCGRPCDRHRVRLRDRVGIEHPLRADVGCRNTLFNAVAQSGAHFFAELYAAGLRQFRVELLEENAAETRDLVAAYRALLAGEITPDAVWTRLKARSQLGVTRGTLSAPLTSV